MSLSSWPDLLAPCGGLWRRLFGHEEEAFEIGVHSARGRRWTIAAGGDLRDGAGVARLHATAAELLERRARSLVIDLSGIELADTKLIAALIVIRREARRAGTRLTVRHSPAVLRWLGAFKLQEVCPPSAA